MLKMLQIRKIQFSMLIHGNINTHFIRQVQWMLLFTELYRDYSHNCPMRNHKYYLF